MTTSGKGGVYSGQPVDITVHVVRETGGGGSASTPGNVSGMSSGQRNPPRPTQEPAWAGMPKGGGWDAILGKNPRGSAGPEAPQKQGQDMSSLLGLAKKWFPLLAGVTTVAGIIKKSSVLGTSIGMILDVITMVVDTILMPFLLPILQLSMPLLMLLVKALQKYLNFMMPSGTMAERGKEKGGIWANKYAQMGLKVLDALPGMGAVERSGKPGGGGVLDKAIGGLQHEFSAHNLWKLAKGALPHLASGTGYVSNTGLSMIHKGERVLTAAENAGAGGGNMFNNKFDIHVANNVDASLLDARIADRLETRLGNKFRRT